MFDLEDLTQEVLASRDDVPASKPDKRKDRNVRIIKVNRPSQIEDAMILSMQAHKRTIFRDSPYSLKKASNVFLKALSQPDVYTLYYAQTGSGQTLGYAFVSTCELQLCSEDTYITLEALYVDHDIQKNFLGGKVAKMLVEACHYFKRQNNAIGILAYQTMGREAASASRLFAKMGGEPLGESWLIR